MRQQLTDYCDAIQAWISQQELTRFNRPITDEEIWTRIGILWPTFSPSEKHTIFHAATTRRYTPQCYPSSSSSPSLVSSLESLTTSTRNKPGRPRGRPKRSFLP